MSLKIGDVEVAPKILENEFRLALLEKTLDYIIKSNNGRLMVPSLFQTEMWRKEVVAEMKRKYPNMGLELK